MQGWGENRRLNINLENRDEVEEKIHMIKRNEAGLSEARERYGGLEITECDAIELVPKIIELNKRMLVADGRLLTAAWLFVGKRVVDLYFSTFYDQGSKRLALRKLADRVELLRADSVLFITEAWMAKLEEGEAIGPATLPAGSRPDRMEAIEVTAIARDGRGTCSICTFHHEADGSIVIDDTIHDIQGVANYLEPIRQRWARMENA